MKAKLVAVTSPGGDRHPYADVTFDVATQTCKMTEAEPVEQSIQYFDLVLPDGKRVAPLPPGVDLFALVDGVMSAKVMATFRPQVWHDGRALDLDEGSVEFNILPKLVNMDFESVRRLEYLQETGDRLADDLPEARAHSGPFEVDFDEEDIVQMACLFSGHHGALGDNDSIRDIPEWMWDDACAAARLVLGRHEGELQAATPPKNWEDWVERFKPQPADCFDSSYLIRHLDDPQVLQAIKDDPERVWTSLDVDGESFISSGVSYVNRMGYYLCDVPYVGPMCDFPEDDDAGDPNREPHSWEELVDRFEPQPLPVVRDPGNLLRSADDPELRVALDVDSCRVWTVLNLGGDEKIVNGFHSASGAVYILCNVPYGGPDCEIEGDGADQIERQRG